MNGPVILGPYFGLMLGVAITVPVAIHSILSNRSRLGVIKCNKCGHTGKARVRLGGKMVCSHCKSDDWLRLKK